MKIIAANLPHIQMWTACGVLGDNVTWGRNPRVTCFEGDGSTKKRNNYKNSVLTKMCTSIYSKTTVGILHTFSSFVDRRCCFTQSLSSFRKEKLFALVGAHHCLMRSQTFFYPSE